MPHRRRERQTVESYLNTKWNLNGGVVIPDDLPVAGAAAHFDASKTASVLNGANLPASAGQTVAGWRNVAGTGSTAQSDDAKRPVYGLHTINGTGVLYFDGSNDVLSSTSTYSNTGSAVSAFVVMQRTADVGNYGRSISFIGPDNSTDYGNNSNWCLDNGSNGTTMNVERVSGHAQGTLPAVNTPYLAEVVFNGSTCTTYINGTQLGSAFSSSGNFNINKMAIGAGWDTGTTPAWAMTGDIAEVVLYNSALGTTDRQAVESYLLGKWIQVNHTPTLNAISDPATVLMNAGVQNVSLSGITAGTGDSQTLQVTAASDNTALIPNPTVTYTSPNTSGSISYTPVAGKFGTANVTVTVRDAGLDGTMGNGDDATFSRSFTVSVDGLPVVGAAVWFDASNNASVLNGSASQATNGQTVGTWNNLAIGASGAVTQSTDANRPVYTTNSMNGKAVLHFDGSNDVLSSASTYANTGSSVSAFVVMRRTADSGNYGRSISFIGPDSGSDFDNNANWCLNNNGDGVTMHVERGAGHNQGSLPTVNTAYLAEVIFDGTNCTTYINGTQLGSPFASTGNFDINKMAVGSGWDTGTTPAWGMTGDIAEVVVYNTALGTTNRQAIENYLSTKWLAVNHTPTLNAISNPAAINENASQQTVSLSGITAGPGDTQTLQVTATSDLTSVIPNPTVTYTSPNATGSIAYTPVANTYGTAHVTVTVRDAGLDGTMGNGDDATFARTFTVVVNHVNQAPTLTAISNPATILMNAGLQTVNLAGITAGPGDTQTLQVTATSDKTSLIPNPTVTYTSPNATGSISYTPVAGQFGTAHVTVTVRDAGLDGTMGNGDDATFSRSFTVNVDGLPVVGAAVWFDASNNASVLNGSASQATNGQAVGTWNNLAIGASGAVTQSTDANRPVYTTNSMNGKAILHFDGSNDVLSSTSTYSNTGTAVSAFVVMRRTADSGNYGRSVAFVGPSSGNDFDNIANWSLDNNSDGVTMYVERATGHNQGSLPTVNTAYLAEVIFDGTNCTTYINGAQLGSAFSSSGSFNINKMAVGAGWSDGSTPQWCMTGDIAEIVLYNSALGTTNRQAVESYLSNKWLQVNHTPTLNAISDPAAINENASQQTVSLSGITAGPGDTQALQVTATSDLTSVIPNPTVTYTSPNATGSIAYTPVANTYGTAHVTVTVRDAGLDGTMGSGDDATFARTFTVVVNHVNQTPTLTAISDPATILMNAGVQTVNLAGITAGPGDSQTLQVTAASDNTTLIPNPTVSYTSPNTSGSITYTPVASKFGTAHVTVTVRDAGLDGTMGNGDDATFSRSFTVKVDGLPVVGSAVWFDASYNASVLNGSGGQATAGQTVTQWNNLAFGAGSVQSTGGNGPIYGVDTINGKRVLDFGANVANILQSSSIYTNTGGTVTAFVVMKHTSSHPGTFARSLSFVGPGGNTDWSYNGNWCLNNGPDDNSLVAERSGIGGNFGAIPAIGTAYMSEVIFDGSHLTTYVNGAQLGSTLNYTAVNFNINTIGVGSGIENGAAQNPYDGSIAEIVIYNSALNATDRQAVENYLSAKWLTNHAPTLNSISDPAAIMVNAGQQAVSLAGIADGEGGGQTLQVTATSDNTTVIPNPTVTYTSPNATGSLAYTPATNQYGTAHVTVTVRDSGLDGTMGNGDDATYSRTFTVVVTGLPVSGAAVWFDGANGNAVLNSSGTPATTGQAVATWNNIAPGKTGAVTQATTANQPIYGSHTMSGKPVLYFDGTNDVLSSTTTYTNTGSSVSAFIVVRRTADAGNYGRSLGFIGPDSSSDFDSNSNWCVDNNADGVTLYVERGSGHNQGSLPTVNTAYLAEVIFNGSTCTTYINGTQLGSAFSSTGNFNINTMAVGAGWYSGTNAWGITGDIAEVVIYNSALGTTDRQAVESYLNQKWLAGGGQQLMRSSTVAPQIAISSPITSSIAASRTTSTVNAASTLAFRQAKPSTGINDQALMSVLADMPAPGLARNRTTKGKTKTVAAETSGVTANAFVQLQQTKDVGVASRFVRRR